MDERILNELDIEQLQKLREEIVRQELVNQELDKEDNNETGKENSNSKVKSIGAGSITGGLSMYPVYDEKKAGKSNIILLSILSFIFEVLFIFLSLFIYTN